MSEPTPDAVLAAYTKRREAFEAERAKLDARTERLLRRYLAALFREHAGLNAVALACYQDYDTSQRVGHAYVDPDGLATDAWAVAGFPGECPRNDLPPEEAEALERRLRSAFWPSLQRLQGDRWCLAAWRDPAAEPDGFRLEERDHPGFD